MRRLFILCLVMIPGFLFAQPQVFGPTKSSDDLWQIASLAVKNQPVTAHQEAIAIWQQNKQAFHHGNINGLKPGYTLKLPTVADAQKVSLKQAASIIMRQNEVWQKEYAGRIQNVLKQSAISVEQQQIAALQHQVAEEAQDNTALKEQLQNVTAAKQAWMMAHGQQQQQIAALQQQLQQVTQQRANTQKTQSSHTTVRQYLSHYPLLQQVIYSSSLRPFLIVSIVILILLFIWLLWTFNLRRKLCKPIEPTKNEKTSLAKKSQYHYLSGEEPITTKLDLARAYIDMGDNKSAQEILQIVLQEGDKKQQEEANQLLKKIK